MSNSRQEREPCLNSRHETAMSNTRQPCLSSWHERAMSKLTRWESHMSKLKTRESHMSKLTTRERAMSKLNHNKELGNLLPPEWLMASCAYFGSILLLSLLISSWVFTSHQQYQGTSGRITYSQLFYTRSTRKLPDHKQKLAHVF